jgi:hypothetical protein
MTTMGFVINEMQRKALIHRIPAGSADVEPHAQLTMAGYERLEARRKQPRGVTGWDRVDRCLKDAEERLRRQKPRSSRKCLDQRTQRAEDGDEHEEQGGILPLLPGPLRDGRLHQCDGCDFGEAQGKR